MNCKWCSQPFEPEEFKVDMQDDVFHAACWIKKLQSINTDHGPGYVIQKDS